MIAFVKHSILFCKLLSFWKLTKFFCACLRDFLACAWRTKETCEVLFCLWCEPNYAFLKQLSMYHLETLESYDNFASLFFKLQWNYSESLCSWKNMLKNKKNKGILSCVTALSAQWGESGNAATHSVVLVHLEAETGQMFIDCLKKSIYANAYCIWFFSVMKVKASIVGCVCVYACGCVSVAYWEEAAE